MTTETTKLIVRGVPPRLKGKIARRVDREKSNFNTVVVAILADAFGVPYEPNQRRSPREIGPHPNPVLDVPVELKRAIEAEMVERGESQRNVVVEVLAAAFGEPFTPTGRWRNRATA